jgi:hypothetical protein
MTSISTSFMRSSLRDMTDMRDSLLMSLLESLAGGEILSSTCTRLSCCIRRDIIGGTGESAGAGVTDQACVVKEL